MSQSLLEELIISLKEINYPQGHEIEEKYEGLDEFINILTHKMDKDLDANFVGSCIVNALCQFPALTRDQNNGHLYKLTKTMPCTELYFTEYTRHLFFGSTQQSDSEVPQTRKRSR